jgi:VWFA-related protein
MLQSADTVFYALNSGLSASYNPKRNKSGHPTPSQLDRIALETGGREFKTAGTNLENAFDQIDKELRSMYSIGYVSSNKAEDGKFRKIEIRVNGPGLKARARGGYRQLTVSP